MTKTCSFCRATHRVVKSCVDNKYYCNKHWIQMNRFGKIFKWRDKNQLVIRDDHATIILRDKNDNITGRTLIDLEDVQRTIKLKWVKNQSGGYAVSNTKDKKVIRMQRFILNYGGQQVVDHINHNPLDNRKNNLRAVSQTINMRNIKIPKGSKSNCVGVSWSNDRNKWVSSIGVNKKRINLGRFKDFDEAVRVRKKAELKYFGEVIVR